MDRNKEKIPHQAEILLRAEIMERLPDGHMNGLPLKKISKLFTVFGTSLDECTERVEAFIKLIERIKEIDIINLAQEEGLTDGTN